MDTAAGNDVRPADLRSGPTLPVIEESLSVGKVTEVTGAVRVRIEAGERIETVDADTVANEVDVQRIARDVVVETARTPWQDGETLVVPVYRERTVVRHELVLVEEIHLRTRTASVSERTEHALRQEVAVVERQQPDGTWRSADDP